MCAYYISSSTKKEECLNFLKKYTGTAIRACHCPDCGKKGYLEIYERSKYEKSHTSIHCTSSQCSYSPYKMIRSLKDFFFSPAFSENLDVVYELIQKHNF